MVSYGRGCSFNRRRSWRNPNRCHVHSVPSRRGPKYAVGAVHGQNVVLHEGWWETYKMLYYLCWGYVLTKCCVSSICGAICHKAVGLCNSSYKHLGHGAFINRLNWVTCICIPPGNYFSDKNLKFESQKQNISGRNLYSCVYTYIHPTHRTDTPLAATLRPELSFSINTCFWTHLWVS